MMSMQIVSTKNKSACLWLRYLIFWYLNVDHVLSNALLNHFLTWCASTADQNNDFKTVDRNTHSKKRHFEDSSCERDSIVCVWGGGISTLSSFYILWLSFVLKTITHFQILNPSAK